VAGRSEVGTPSFRINELNEILHGENIEFLRDDLAFAVASCMVEYNDPDLLKRFPPWITALVLEMCNSYREHGSYGIISNLGEADHSLIVGNLVSLLESSH
jgi:hypothetical protein